MKETFKSDVDKGLSANQKYLPSKYFYNAKGDALFVQIMNAPEYYLTRCELEIFQEKTQDLIHSLAPAACEDFDLIELGAGDGMKTKELIRALIEQERHFNYRPVDISTNALSQLKTTLEFEMPSLKVTPICGDYFEVLSSLKKIQKPKVILFLGSNIGNLNDTLAAEFMQELSKNLNTGDKLLLGVDLMKSAEIVLPAYSDKEGITAQFNLNLLDRINEELHANFNGGNFFHEAYYDEQEGIAKSYLVSKINQEVAVESIGKVFRFQANEKIQMEISRKYNDALIEKIISSSSFKVVEKILDNKSYFANYILEMKRA